MLHGCRACFPVRARALMHTTALESSLASAGLQPAKDPRSSGYLKVRRGACLLVEACERKGAQERSAKMRLLLSSS